MKVKKLSETSMRIAFSKGQEFGEQSGAEIGYGCAENNRRAELAFLYGALGETYQETLKKIEDEL